MDVGLVPEAEVDQSSVEAVHATEDHVRNRRRFRHTRAHQMGVSWPNGTVSGIIALALEVSRHEGTTVKTRNEERC